MINKTYVINLSSRPDRWKKTQKNFQKTGLEFTRWNAVYGKNLTEKEINDHTTPLCREICHPAIIGTWLSHYGIWKNIVQNRETNVLILEDDAIPINDFNKKLSEAWTDLPPDWDFLFLGCFGSCDYSTLTDQGYHLLSGRVNKPVYVHGRISQKIFRPCFPLCLQAYMLSYKGALKLINHPKLQKVRYHIDYTLSYHVFPDESFRMYALKNALVKHNLINVDSNIQSYGHHPVINTFGSKIQIAEHHNFGSWSGVNLFSLRRFGLDFTVYLFVMVLMSYIVGMLAPNRIFYGYVFIILLFNILETSLAKKISITYLKTVTFETTLIIVSIILGRTFGCYIGKC